MKKKNFKIKIVKYGSKNFYRVIVISKKKSLRRKPLDILGVVCFFKIHKKILKIIKLDITKLSNWLIKGSDISARVSKILGSMLVLQHQNYKKFKSKSLNIFDGVNKSIKFIENK